MKTSDKLKIRQIQLAEIEASVRNCLPYKNRFDLIDDTEYQFYMALFEAEKHLELLTEKFRGNGD